MKFDSIQALSIAALLAAAVAALPLASSPASAQISPQLNDDSFGFDDTLTAADTNNVTGMSFLIISGMNMVEGAKVTGAVMNSEDEISVTLTNENETGESDAVTVVAFTGTMDIMSMLSSGQIASFMDDNSSSFGNNNSIATTDDNNSGPGSNARDDGGGELDDSGRDSPSDFDDIFTEDFASTGNDTAFAHSMNPMDLFENMKTGSAVVQQGWESPEIVNVTLIGNATDTTPTAESDTTFVFVMIVPYTTETEEQTTTLEG